MAEDAVLPILQKIQTDIAEIKSTLSAMRSEIDGGFHMMAGTDGRVGGLEAMQDEDKAALTNKINSYIKFTLDEFAKGRKP